LKKHLCSKGWAALLFPRMALPVCLLALPGAGFAATCTSAAEMLPTDRDPLAAAAYRLALAVGQQDFTTLQASLLPAVASQWEGIRSAAEQAAPLLKGGQAQIRSLYLLDATTLTAPADTQFFCSDSTGALTVTLAMRALPPGRYAVVLVDAASAPMAGQMGLILAWEGGASGGWKLGGFSAREGSFDGHDGVWYWTRAREVAKSNLTWSAWYCYDAARYLLVPVDFLSSPNLDKLNQEQQQLKESPHDAFPYTIADGPRSWKIDAMGLDTTLHEADLGVTYESLGLADPAAARTEAVAVLSALLKVHPGLRENFHGLWAYAQKDGKRSFAIELPMAQIP
jgi:hypothetical protein